MNYKLVALSALAGLVLASPASSDQKLAQKHGCLNCHLVAKKVVGPSFVDVSRKYKGDAGAQGHLLGVIKKGGKGVWGNVPMPPHPQVPEGEARSLVTWVLAQ